MYFYINFWGFFVKKKKFNSMIYKILFIIYIDKLNLNVILDILSLLFIE